MLIDELISRMRYKSQFKDIYKALTGQKTICIDIENLLPYIQDKTMGRADKHPIDAMLEQCFDLRMPGETTWIEAPTILCDLEGRAISGRQKMGYLMGFSETDIDALKAFGSSVDEHFADEVLAQNATYTITVRTFAQREKEIIGLPWVSFVYLKDNGEIIKTRNNFAFQLLSGNEISQFFGIPKNEAKQIAGQFAAESLVDPIMASSLLNVKNVGLHLEPVDQKLQQKRIKRGKLPLVKMHTLEILTPGIKKANTTSSTSRNGTSSKPLHLVRGHLADYRDGSGLFGKHKGIFWMPAHFRGDSENGIIKKRYKVASNN